MNYQNRRTSRFGRRRSDHLIAIAVVVALVAVVATYSVSCNNGGSDSSSDFPTGNSVVPGSVSGANPGQPQAALPVEPTGLDIKITNTGNVLNGTATTYTACLFDAPYGAGQLVDEWKAKPGVTSSDYEVQGCDTLVGQIDIIDGDKCPQVPHGLQPLAANPKVTISADGIEWLFLEPVKENISEWSECHETDLQESTRQPRCNPETREGVKTKTFDLVQYKVNTCSDQRYEVSREQKIWTKKCSYETGEKVCDAGITHTQNDQWCGYQYKNWQWEYVCQKNWFLFSDKKWQCQSVPPGTPGHYPNHFDHPQHDDYFGEPDSEHCYSITN